MCTIRLEFIGNVIAFVFVLITKPTLGQEEYCPQNNTRYCLLRDAYWDQQLWKYWTGYMCYNYTNSARLYVKYNATSYYVNCKGKTTYIPVALINDTTYAFFDYENEDSMLLIRQSFINDDVFNNYLKCCIEAVDCCENYMDSYNVLPNDTHCPAIWDAWSCFPPTDVNTTAKLPCSSQAYQSPDQVCQLTSEKHCIWNGTTSRVEWNQTTDYSVCAIASVYEARHLFHVIFLGVCTIFCSPAIIIFLSFEKFRRSIRIALHRNLLIAICVRNLFTIMSKQLIILDALLSPRVSNMVMENNGVPCRILAFLENSAKNCIYACMLLDGFYLHKVIVRAFAKELNMIYCYIILAGLTFLPSLIWAASMGITQADSCWMVDTSGLQWIVDSLRIVILVVNTILLLDILRVMLVKVKQKSTSSQTRAALRATLFLVPLFGIHIAITAHKWVYDDSCRAEDIYDYTRYAMEALQGIFVALLFCYANNEVHNELKNAHRKFTIYVEQRYGWKLRRETVYRRRTTAATYVETTKY